MPSKKPLLICIVGTTAIGKTSLAIKIAQAFSTIIISADSRQFYKEMSIGTAVPTEEELNQIPHYFIQNKSIFDSYSVGDFEKEALDKLVELFKTHSIIIMVGGSGLYIDAVVKGLDQFPHVNPDIRKQLNIEFTLHGIKPLQQELLNVDPNYYDIVDTQNAHRLIRALEVYRGTGKPYSKFLAKKTKKRDFDTLFIGLTAKRETIYARINQRVDTMIEQGLIEEALELEPHKELNALQTVGYRELFKYFDDEISKEDAIEEIKKNTRRFAKRQSTWFRKNEAINWFDYQTNPSEIISFIKNKKTL